jgi:hypothetical protein
LGRRDIVTTTTFPPSVLSDPEARQQLIDGIHNATATLGAFWPELVGMAEHDMRWDDLCERAIEMILPQVGAMLDAAIAAEWRRFPVEL